MYSKEYVEELYEIIVSKDKTIDRLRNELADRDIIIGFMESEAQRLFRETTKDTT